MSPTATRTSHELDVYGKRGITLVRGGGARLWDDTGREYIDCMSAHGAAILGHAHPRIAEALERQARTLTSCPGSFYHPGKEKLIERLADRCPNGLDRVFLCNSGTEAVEAAIKFARASTGRPAVVAAKRGFHGRTFGAMSASFNPKHHELYAPVVPGTRFIAFNDTAALEDALERGLAARQRRQPSLRKRDTPVKRVSSNAIGVFVQYMVILMERVSPGIWGTPGILLPTWQSS